MSRLKALSRLGTTVFELTSRRIRETLRRSSSSEASAHFADCVAPGLALPVEDGLNDFSPSCRCHSALAATPGTCRACTSLSTTARASSEHSVRVQALEVEHTEGSLVALSQTVPLGMGGLRRSVQTFPFARRSIDHFKRTLHDNNFYCRERLGKLSISAYIFLRFCRIRSTSWLVLGRLHPRVPGRASPDLRVRPWPPPGGRGRWQWRLPGCTCTSGADCILTSVQVSFKSSRLHS